MSNMNLEMTGKKNNDKKDIELESMSPATKLLEKRRLMYEEQEKYEQNKDNFKKEEENFKNQEAELIKKDLSLQNHMIGFSNILQENERKKKKAREKADNESGLIAEKETELQRKHQELKTLKRQTDNISVKVSCMKEYESFLENVKESNQDEYTELSDIRSRHMTLDESNKKLKDKQKQISAEFERVKTEKNQYFNQTTIEIMSLHNHITNKQSKYEKWKIQEKKIKGNLEEETAKQLKKTSEIGLILMAIDNLYTKCVESGSHLKYRLPNEVNQTTKKTESFAVRTRHSIKQINLISDYYEDFENVLSNLKVQPKKI
jgi:hypothetical protein